MLQADGRQRKAAKDQGIKEAVKAYIVKLFETRREEALAALRAGGRSCKMLRELVARELSVDSKVLKKREHPGNESWFRLTVEDTVLELDLLDQLPTRVVTRELVALILSKDATERRQRPEDENVDLCVSGSQLRHSLSQSQGQEHKKKSAFFAPTFGLLGPAEVKRLNRLHDLPCRGVEFEESLLTLSMGGRFVGSELHFWSPRKVFDRLSGAFSYLLAIRLLVQAERLISDVELVLAGGAVSAYFQGRSSHFYGDLDCFFVSPSGDVAAASVFLDKLLNVFYDNGNADLLLFERSESCTTVRWPDNEERYQFIHRLYPNASAVIGGFDLGICAVMLHEGFSRLSLTHLGAWSNALGVNFVDTSRRSTSFEWRISKYARRGVTMVFPGINRPQLMQRLLDPPHSVSLNGLQLHMPRHQPNAGGAHGCRCVALQGTVEEVHDYDDFDVALYPEVYLATRNWYHAILKRPEKLSIWSSEPSLSNNCLFDRPLSQFVERVENPTRPPSCRKISDFFRQVFGKERGLAYVVAEMNDDKAEMKRLREETINDVTEVYLQQGAKLCSGPLWRTENPGSQWTGSVNPIMEDPRKFYGTELYDPMRVLVTDQVFLSICLLRRESALWRPVPRDVLKIIARMTVLAQYQDLIEEAFGRNRPKQRRCCGCEGTGSKMKACGRCRSVFYCCIECQRSHWPAHSIQCNAAAAASKLIASAADARK